MLLKTQHSALFYTNRPVAVEFCHVWPDGFFCQFLNLQLHFARLSPQLDSSWMKPPLERTKSEPGRMVSFRAFSGRQNQSSPCSGVVFMAQPCGLTVLFLVFLPMWKLCIQVPQEPWALPCVFWDTGHICTRKLLSQLSSQTVCDVEE